MTINNRIREIRKYKGLTQKRLGELCGISEVQIGKYELGLISPKIDTAKKIANALDVSLCSLICDKDYIGENK